MDLKFGQEIAKGYKSHSQSIRVLSEVWAERNLFCPRCGCAQLEHFKNNRPVADFYCPVCGNEYELKSKKGAIGRKIADGAYHTFIQRITSDSNPDFFILSYNPSELCVDNLWVVPKHFFVPEIVEKRKPLADSARRAGWTGCNILFDQIPEQGKICMVKNRTVVEKDRIIAQMQRSTLLKTASMEARGWLLDILQCVNQIKSDMFTLEDMYQNESALEKQHPQNKNIRAKIRQQLQILRDKGFIEFVGRGLYRKRKDIC